ncbi:MAG: hypothetical protein M1358_01470, partial [Chloroflexi bacterium]|nr:hypothetical protein [Chloroflexota bacterium]
MKRVPLFVSVLFLILLIFPSIAFSAPTSLPDGTLLFPETGKALRGLLEYWLSHGGLAQFGYPIGNAVDREDRPFSYQYFERALMEVWFDPSGNHTMKLALLGSELTKNRQNAMDG